MAVDVKRKRGGGVTNVLLYGFDVVTILQREHGVGMPKVVKTSICHTEIRNNFLEMLVDCCTKDPAEIIEQMEEKISEINDQE